MNGVCGCGRRSPPILVAVRVNPAKKIHIKFVKLCMITHTKGQLFYLTKFTKKYELAFGHVSEDHQRSSGIRSSHATPNKTAKPSGIEKKGP